MDKKNDNPCQKQFLSFIQESEPKSLKHKHDPNDDSGIDIKTDGSGEKRRRKDVDQKKEASEAHLQALDALLAAAEEEVTETEDRSASASGKSIETSDAEIAAEKRIPVDNSDDESDSDKGKDDLFEKLDRAITKNLKSVVKDLLKDNDLDLNTILLNELLDDYGDAGYNTYLLIRTMRDMDIDMLRFLIEECGADVNVKDEVGKTPIIEAAFRGKDHHVDLLCKKGADTQGSWIDRDVCWNCNVWWKYNSDYDIDESTDVWDTLIENGVKLWANEPAIVHMGFMEWEDLGLKYIMKLLKIGATVNDQKASGSTVLMSALARGNYNIVNMLLKQKDIDINIRDNRGETAMFHAVTDEYFKLMTPDPEEPWYKSMVRKRINVIKKLLTKGADINARNNNGDTLLIKAVRCESTLLAEFFLKKGLDVNATNNSGQTAMTRLFQFQYDDVSKMEKLLIKYGATPYPKTKKGSK